MIIATISGSFSDELIYDIVNHSLIRGVRFNTGVPCIHTPYEMLCRLKTMTSKPIWIDLKCRQLRIAKWATPYYGEIELNHEIEIKLPAQIHFRGVGWADIRAVRGNKIYLKNPPEKSIGQGQSVNISSDFLKINGYFTEDDLRYIKAADNLGLGYFMLSFFENEDDIDALKKLLSNIKNPYIGLKIESLKGIKAAKALAEKLAFADRFLSEENLKIIVARDDLLINFKGDELKIIEVLQDCIEDDNQAMVASQFFSGLEHTGCISAADISDIHLMNNFNFKNHYYKYFMLSDEICLRHFHQVMDFWENYLKWSEI